MAPATPTVDDRKIRLNRKLVLLVLLVPYLLVELAFNHQLLTLTTGMLDSEALKGIEIWGRIISGIGLGLLIWTFVIGQRLPALSALLLSLALGITLMWHLQKTVIDYWVSRAPIEDKQLSLALAMLSQAASSGQLHTEHGPVLKRPPGVALQLTVASLFPASALHAGAREQLVMGWARQMGSDYQAADLARIPPEQADNAYRNLIVPPLALGLSLLFALLNMAQLGYWLIRLGALLLRRDARRLGPAQPVLAILLIAGSVWSCNAFLDSAGYREDLRPGLWRQSPALATLTEWTLRAEPRWYALAEWSHNTLLMKASFRLPWLTAG
jgi:hypothetical protein